MTVDAASGDPVNYTIDGPGTGTGTGTGANIATIPVSVSGNTITLTPPASVLTGSGTTYPVYIDPTWHNRVSSDASAWTQVFSGYPTETSMYDKNEDLRVGVCPTGLALDCNGIGVARSFPGCGYFNKDIAWDVTSTIANDAGDVSSQTWGLRAGDESTSDIGTSELYWKKFKSGASNFTLSVQYNYPPNQPTHLSTDPGGGCHTSQGDPAVTGHDDVTFFSLAADDDGDNNNLSTEIHVYNTSGTSLFSTRSRPRTTSWRRPRSCARP